MKKSNLAIRTGFTGIDEMTGGLKKGELICVASRPGMGKTALALNIAANVALSKEPEPVLFISLEMNRLAILQRLVAAEANVGITGLRTGFFRGDRWQDITSTVARFIEAPLVINKAPGNSAMNIRKTWHEYIDIVERLFLHKPMSTALRSGETPQPINGKSAITVLNIRARSLAVRKGLRQDGKELGLIVIDPVQLLGGPSQGKTRQQELSEISRDLKGLAFELHIPIIAVSQLSRLISPEVRTDTHPQMSELCEFGPFGENADLVLFAHREYPRAGSPAAINDAVNPIPQWDDAKSIAAKPPIPECDDAEIVVAKNPRGKTGAVKMKFQRKYVTFSDWGLNSRKG